MQINTICILFAGIARSCKMKELHRSLEDSLKVFIYAFSIPECN
jgi:hypothetical protein